MRRKRDEVAGVKVRVRDAAGKLVPRGTGAIVGRSDGDEPGRWHGVWRTSTPVGTG